MCISQRPDDASKSFLAVLISLVILLAGCGEDNKTAMMRIAKARAAAKESQEAEDKERLEKLAKETQAAAAQATPGQATPGQATPGQATPGQATPGQATPGQGAAPQPPAVQATPAPAPAQAQSPLPTPNQVVTQTPAYAGTTTITPNVTIPTSLLAFDASGKAVAYSGDGNSIGVHDVETKALVRKAYNEQLTPTVAAIDELRSQLVVGGSDGTLKTFALGMVKGLDRYAQERLLRRDRDPPRKAHAQAITAIAVNTQSKVLATGDLTGELRLWSADTGDSVSYPGGEGGFVKLRAYQKDIVFALTKRRKLLFWKTGQGGREPSEYATINDNPTVMQVGPKGKGLVIGDDSGRVTMWLPEGSELKKQSFQAHSTAVSGISFNAAGDSLITASRSGELLKWNLPLNGSHVVELEETARFLTASNNGRLLAVPSRKSYLDVYSAANNSKLRSFQVPVIDGLLPVDLPMTIESLWQETMRALCTFSAAATSPLLLFQSVQAALKIWSLHPRKNCLPPPLKMGQSAWSPPHRTTPALYVRLPSI